jgi:parallel beta-helix repeat protein
LLEAPFAVFWSISCPEFITILSCIQAEISLDSKNPGGLMKSICLFIFFCSLTVLLVSCAEKIEIAGGRTIIVDASSEVEEADGTDYAPYSSLEEAIASAESGDEIYILPGQYEAESEPFIEPLCGNCTDHKTEVRASSGFHIKDKALSIIGKHADSVILITNAGYGVLFDHSQGSILKNVTITGGKRDPDGNATDAAVVVRYSQVIVEDCKIVDNDHQLDTVIVGIGGVFGRESSQITIRNNLIENNGWDGIALYRGASAFISDNIINKGRGAGIGITWDSKAIVIRNDISNYWKGIGTFGNSWAAVLNNIVRDNLGWGVVATGFSIMEVRNNTIARNGNCGFAAWSTDARGYLKNNIIAFNGWREEWVCPCVGVWMNGKLANFPVSYNDVYGNQVGEYLGMPEWTGRYGNISVDPLFIDSLDFRLSPESPLNAAGDPYYTNSDGSRSNIGAYGGQEAK